MNERLRTVSDHINIKIFRNKEYLGQIFQNSQGKFKFVPNDYLFVSFSKEELNFIAKKIAELENKYT